MGVGPATAGAPSDRPASIVRRGAGRTFRSWRYPDYRRLWLCVGIANSGRWALALGVGWLLYSLTHSSAWVGASFFCIQGPALVVAPLTGVWADRYDRRRVLAVALALATIGAATLTLLAVVGVASAGAVLAGTLVCGIAFTMQGTAWGSLLPGIVPREDLPNAVALQGTARQGAEFIGPALASPLLAFAGAKAVFAVAALCYLTALWLATGIRAERGAAVLGYRGRNPYAPLRDGLRYVIGLPLLGSVVFLVAFHCSLTMTYQGLLPQFAASNLGGGDAQYGALMTMVGLGAIVGTLTLASIGSRWHGSGYAATAVVSGLALALLGASRSEAPALVAAIAVGAAQAMFMAISLTFLQQMASNAYLGRVTGLYNFLASGTMAWMSWGLGNAASAVSPGMLMEVAGAAFVVVVAVASLGAPTFRRLCVVGAMTPPVGASAVVGD